MTRPYRVYIAAASVPSEIERVDRWAAKLTAAGIEVVSTWPRNIREVGAANPREATREQRRRWAEACIGQVDATDVLWLMCPPIGVQTRGAWSELARAYDSATIISSGDTTQSIFTALGEECTTDDFAFARIIEESGCAEVSEPISLLTRVTP